eukprot:350589-Chlamydomonas_euryale.AAC.2
MRACMRPITNVPGSYLHGFALKRCPRPSSLIPSTTKAPSLYHALRPHTQPSTALHGCDAPGLAHTSAVMRSSRATRWCRAQAQRPHVRSCLRTCPNSSTWTARCRSHAGNRRGSVWEWGRNKLGEAPLFTSGYVGWDAWRGSFWTRLGVDGGFDGGVDGGVKAICKQLWGMYDGVWAVHSRCVISHICVLSSQELGLALLEPDPKQTDDDGDEDGGDTEEEEDESEDSEGDRGDGVGAARALLGMLDMLGAMEQHLMLQSD